MELTNIHTGLAALRDSLNVHATKDSPLLRSALKHLDNCIDDIEDKLASAQRKEKENESG